jgi:hypothetical protein
MTSHQPSRPIYVLRLQPLPRVDGVKALRRALKYLLRACGLRCISVEWADGDAP